MSGRGVFASLLLGLVATGGGAFAAGEKITQTIDGVPFYVARGEVRSERVIKVDGSPLTLATWEERAPDGSFLPWAGVSLDGQAFARVTEVSYELGLRYAHFDPLVNVPAVPERLAAGDDIGLYIVQFFTQPVPEFRRDIEARGGLVRHYIAQYAYLVQMSPAARATIAALPYVRWIGRYEPAYRLEEYMIENLDHASSAYPHQHYNIQLLAESQKPVVAARIGTIGGTLESPDAGKYLIEATLTPEQLFQVIRWDEVLFVDRWGPIEPDMNIAREIGGGNYVETVAGFRGEGVRGEVFDGGFNLGHTDFALHPLIPHGTVGSDSHGASTSGIVFGRGVTQPNGRGMLPEGQGIVCDHNFAGGISGPSRRTRTSELVAPPYNAVFQSSSVGSPQTTQYTTISADTDDMLFDFDIVFCQSQSNLGTQSSRPQAWAKNIISGGAVYHFNTLTKADDHWNHGASIGPASDGRIKPTLCSFYDQIWTTDCCTPTAYTQVFGGTSGATPIIAGHVGLVFQMWSQGIFGNPFDPGGTVFDNRPHASTARALLINTADQYDFVGTTVDLTRVHQGWGMPSVKNLYDLRNQLFIVDETDVIQQFQTTTYAVDVAPGTPALKATMVYADPAGNPAVQTQHRVNDLTLQLISPSATVYYGNFGLIAGVWSPPGNFADHKNTEENVFVQNPEAGVWRVKVTAEEVIEDSHVETPEMDADYALVVSGVTGELSSVGGAPIIPSQLAFRIQGIRPDNPEAELDFNLASPAHVRLALHDVLGRRIATLVDGGLTTGAQTVKWDGRDVHGATVAPGVYYARLEVGSAASTGKLLVVR